MRPRLRLGASSKGIRVCSGGHQVYSISPDRLLVSVRASGNEPANSPRLHNGLYCLGDADVGVRRRCPAVLGEPYSDHVDIGSRRLQREQMPNRFEDTEIPTAPTRDQIVDHRTPDQRILLVHAGLAV